MPEITRFDPALHDLAAFSCGVDEVDAFFSAGRNRHNFRFFWEQRVGGMFVALEDGKIVGALACAASRLPLEVAEVVGRDLRAAGRKGRQKPRDMGEIPAVRIVILGVRPDRRRVKIGTALLAHAFSAFTAPVYYLFPQRGSESFYDSLGFVRASAGLREMRVKIVPARALPPRPL